MTNSYRTLIASTAAAAFAALLLVPMRGQGPDDEKSKAKAAAKAKNIAQIFAVNARTLTVYDRQGKVLTTVGPRALYTQPVFSPDAKRLAVVKADLDKETNEMWVLDIATGNATQITFSKAREGAQGPAWSPDGSQVAYVALRGGNFELCRKASSGEGSEEILYRHNAPMTLTDWSMDGRYLNFFSTDLSGGTLYALPLNGAGERKPIEIFRSPKQAQGGRFSPDARFVSYASNESGKNEIYVRAFDPSASASARSASGVQQWQVSDQGGTGMAFWRRDGKELYYLAADRGVMAVSVSTAPAVELGKPKLLFRPPPEIPVAPGTASISRDGERIVIAVPPPQLRTITMLDRQGKAVSTVGEPGLYNQPGLSPDGKRVVVMRNDPKTGNLDIWTYEVGTGKGAAITDDAFPENAPVWSPDSKQVAYVSTREKFASIYRKSGDGTGAEEQVFQYTPGAGMVLTDWSPDGKFMTFYTGVLVVVPLAGNAKATERKEIDWLREEYDVVQGRFSPDMRYMAYLSNEADPDVLEVYVRPFDAAKPETTPAGPVVKVSKNGSNGMVAWRQDGKEMYFLTRDWEVMAVDVSTTPTFTAGTPKLLFKLPGPMPGNPAQWKNVSSDGQRFVFAMPTAATAPPR